MSDTIDRASKEVDATIESQIRASVKPVLGLEHDKYCHYCGEDVEPPKLFCNGECASKHDKMLSRR